MAGEIAPPTPEGLSPWARATWRDLHALNHFKLHEALALERALRLWDLSDKRLAEAEATTGADRGRLEKMGLDASTAALRHWRLLRFAGLGEGQPRVGRPSGNNWSDKRKQALAY